MFPDIPIPETPFASTKEPAELIVKPLMFVPDPPGNIVNAGISKILLIFVPDLLIMFKGFEIFK